MNYTPFTLVGKKILITGASSGIGRATAIECSKLGAEKCILVGRREEALHETARMMEVGCIAEIKACDVADPAAINELIEGIDIIDGLVCNAGINKMKPLQFHTEKDLEAIFEVNCFSPILMIKQMVKKKKFAHPASIVFTASISGYSNVSVGNALYGASKSALSAYMKYAALELAPKGIRCNAIHPGRVETPLILSGSPTGQEEIKEDIKRYPAGRYGRPEEIAWSIIYLLSDASAWVTGTDLVIDGGRSLI